MCLCVGMDVYVCVCERVGMDYMRVFVSMWEQVCMYLHLCQKRKYNVASV